MSTRQKRILVLTFLSITFLLSSAITYAPSSKSPKIQTKSKLTTDQSRQPSRIKMWDKDGEEYLEEEYLERKERGLLSKASSSNIELVGMWPYGACEASAFDTNRNIAVIGNGETLQVLDISTPSLPSKIGEVFLEAKPYDIVISGNYAYVLTLDSLRVIDISILSSPDEVGFLDMYGYSIAVDYPYVYVAALYFGLDY